MTDETGAQRRKKTRKSLQKRLKRIREGLQKKRLELQECENFEKYDHLGQLLKANFYQLKPKMTSLTVEDFQNPGTFVTIELDPELSAAQHLAFFFKKSKKLQKGFAPLQKAIYKLQEEEKKTDGWLTKALNATSDEEIDLIQKECGFANKLRQKSQKEKKKSNYYAFFSHGTKILVGKDGRSNDCITFQLAKGSDIWLHLQGASGPHVVIQKKKNSQLEKELLIDGANLAIYFSKKRNDLNTAHEVVWTERKNVRRVKSAKPGQVMLAQFKTVAVKLDPDRIRELKKQMQA